MTANAAVEFLIWLLIAASAIAVVSNWLRIPYTVALVLGGLVLGFVHLPIVATLVQNQPDWLTPNIVLVIFLPALLFGGSLKLQVRQLRDNALPILLLATAGVLAATLITGFAAHWLLALPLSETDFGEITSGRALKARSPSAAANLPPRVPMGKTQAEPQKPLAKGVGSSWFLLI